MRNLAPPSLQPSTLSVQWVIFPRMPYILLSSPERRQDYTIEWRLVHYTIPKKSLKVRTGCALSWIVCLIRQELHGSEQSQIVRDMAVLF